MLGLNNKINILSLSIFSKSFQISLPITLIKNLLFLALDRAKLLYYINKITNIYNNTYVFIWLIDNIYKLSIDAKYIKCVHASASKLL